MPLIRTLHLADAADAAAVESILEELRLDPAATALETGARADIAAAVRAILSDVAKRGDDAVVHVARQFDDPQFSPDQLRVSPDEMKHAAARVPADQLAAVRQSIAQVRQYQEHILPRDIAPLKSNGKELGLRFTPIDRVGLCVPGGKASYPSSLIMLAVPAQVAGVKQIVVCVPASKFGKSDLMLATMHELGLTNVFRAGGAAAVAAMAFGTDTIPAVDKIVGPGNLYMQTAKRLVAGGVGLDGFLGPSEILILADETGDAVFIAADMLAQAEHDPGCCFLLTTSDSLAHRVEEEITRQVTSLQRKAPIENALRDFSAIVVDPSMSNLIALANRFAAEHVNIQARDDTGVLKKLTSAGAVFLGRFSPVAAGDYVAGPSHCLPTNTTARFGSGISVYEFLKRSSVVRYSLDALKSDANAIVSMAHAEQLGAHAKSVEIRVTE